MDAGLRGDAVVSLRPTATQAAARGAYVAGPFGMGVGALLIVLVPAGASGGMGLPGWFVTLVPAMLLVGVGALAGMAFGREEGADIDDSGIHPVPGVLGDDAPWQRIQDLRTERSGGRIRVAVQFDTGQVARLPAPYHGRWLAGDREFERKLFMLRNLWETHRSFTIGNQFPPDAASHDGRSR